MKRGYMYYSNQQPIMQRSYYGPKKFDVAHALCDFETIEEGDAPLIHMGHGQFHRFVCVAVDEGSALLVASNI